MENIFIALLPPWVETGLQPAFYDKESGTILQQVSRMWAKMIELGAGFNKFTKDTADCVNEYISKFTDLYNYVHDYFDNLDVQEEINNKLDAMVEAGTLQEIITAYIQSNVAWVFDTVADMKLAENLVSGSYAQTLGFYSANDGGGAIYKITDSGTANEMDVIAIGSTLYANLQYGNEINVKQLGAYGDNTHSDDTFITRGVTLANSTSLPLAIPEGTYKIDNAITMKHIKINCIGYINNANLLTLGANSSGSTKTNVYMYRCNNVQIEGAKNSYFNIEHAGNITLYADGNSANYTSIAYNKIDGIACTGLTITGENGGWINENEINIKRCSGDILITGDYPHNNNHITDICIEGSEKKIQIENGHNNYIYYRGESNPTVTIDNGTSCFGNVVAKQYTSIFYRLFDQAEINTNNTLNFIGKQNQPTIKLQQIMGVNKKSIKSINADLYINSSDLIAGSYKTIYQNSNLNGNLPFAVLVEADIASQRVYIKCFDENDQPMQANVRSTGTSWNSTNQEYGLGSDTKRQIITYYPTDGVKRIELRIATGTHAFGWANAYMISNFYNIDNLENEIDITRKYLDTAPTSTGRYWEKGDIIYNSNPTAGGNIGWVCVETGHPGTWKAFGTISS